MSFTPPPRRTPPASAYSSGSSTPEPSGWRAKMAAKSKSWGAVAIEKVTVVSDNVGGRVNTFAANRLGTEAFWPVTGDFPQEMDKAARILKQFTVDGIVTEDKKKKIKLVRKIPPKVIAEAKGLAIFTSMRSGIAPLGGAGGAGLVTAKLPDGTWSAPSCISPNNISTGFLIGVDIYDCILVIRTQKALDSFGTHKFTLGTEIAVAAGPWGAGAAVEAGKEAAPVFSYVKSKGLYAGVEVVGQVFVERYEENGNMYHWPGVKARDILAGKVAVPREMANLTLALQEAESGRAQSRTNAGALEYVFDPKNVPRPTDDLELGEGEVLKLPPTPEMTNGHECESDPETEAIIRRSGLNKPDLPKRPGTAPPTGPPPPLPPRSSMRPVSIDQAPADYPSPSGLPPHLLVDASDSSEKAYAAPVGPPPHLAATYAPLTPSPLTPEVVTPVSPISPMAGTSTSTATAEHADDAPPPAYDPSSSASHSGFPDEKKIDFEKLAIVDDHAHAAAAPDSPKSEYNDDAYGGIDDTMPAGEMTEGERREWEQHLAAQKDAAREQEMLANKAV